VKIFTDVKSATRAQCYKTFFARNLRFFILS